jgi:hypothetical protein
MSLGTILKTVENAESAEALFEVMNDVVLMRRVQYSAERFGETTGEYVINATRRFEGRADDAEWTALIGAAQRDPDPAAAALRRMLEWALKHEDAEAVAGSGSGSGASGPTCGCSSR